MKQQPLPRQSWPPQPESSAHLMWRGGAQPCKKHQLIIGRKTYCPAVHQVRLEKNSGSENGDSNQQPLVEDTGAVRLRSVSILVFFSHRWAAFTKGKVLLDHSGRFDCILPLGQTRRNFTTRANSMKRTEYAFATARRRACMERPVRRRSSPMEPASRPNPLTQQHRSTLSKHSLWRCECTESEQ